MLLFFLLLMDALVILSFSFTPYITRKTELFGVSIPSDKSGLPDLNRLRASYRNQMLGVGAVLLVGSVVLALLGGWEDVWVFWAWIAAIFVYLLLGFILYLPKHRTMKLLKAERGWADEQKPAVVVADTTPSSKDVISPAWLLLYPLIIAAGIGIIALVWRQVPDPIPLHFNMEGVADNLVAKSPAALIPLLATEVFLAVMLSFVYFIIRFARRQTDAANPRESLAQSKRFRRISSIFLLVLGCIVLIFIIALQILSFFNSSSPLILLIPIIGLLVVVCAGIWYLMFRVGQGGSRLRTLSHPKAGTINYDDDRYWKLGQFYFNPDDPAIIVEKRFGVGWTSNFARPATWLMIGGFVAFIAALLIIVFLFVA